MGGGADGSGAFAQDVSCGGGVDADLARQLAIRRAESPVLV